MKGTPRFVGRQGCHNQRQAFGGAPDVALQAQQKKASALPAQTYSILYYTELYYIIVCVTIA